jgi:hypothetical protein
MENKMAISKVDGNSYSVPPNTKSSGAVNNRGTVARGGSVASGKLTNVGVSRYNTDVFASTVIDNGWADKAVSGGAFAYGDRDGVAMRTTSTIGGVSNTALLAGANVPALVRSIHKLETLRTRRFTTAIRANKYNRYTGQFDNGFPVVATDSLATDTAATPSRAVPGQLTYKLGQPAPVTGNDYKAKTG